MNRSVTNIVVCSSRCCGSILLGAIWHFPLYWCMVIYLYLVSNAYETKGNTKLCQCQWYWTATCTLWDGVFGSKLVRLFLFSLVSYSLVQVKININMYMYARILKLQKIVSEISQGQMCLADALTIIFVCYPQTEWRLIHTDGHSLGASTHSVLS